MMVDWTTFNGYANQYVTHPLTAKPGETTRFYVVAAGPTLDTNFHVVGTLFERAWPNAEMTHYQHGVQTVAVPAGGGAVFDVKIDDEGLYSPARAPRSSAECTVGWPRARSPRLARLSASTRWRCSRSRACACSTCGSGTGCPTRCRAPPKA